MTQRKLSVYAFTLSTVLALGAVTTGCDSSKSSGHKSKTAAAAQAGQTFQVFQLTNGAGTGAVTIDPVAPNGEYAFGTQLTITATPDAGSMFMGWGGDFAGNTDNPLRVVIQNDITLKATFEVPQPGSPTASFTVNPSPAVWIAPLAVTFTDTSSDAPTSWAWDFGDGSTSTDQNPSHTYTTPGSYTVTLTASNAVGAGSPAIQADVVLVADPSEGSRFWYENNLYGQPIKTHDAAKATMAQQVLQLTNAERAAAGLNPLQYDVEAERAAIAHCEDMTARNYFDHISPEGWDPGDRLAMTGASGYQGWAENIAVGQPDAQTVVTDWMNSPGHRANILNPTFTHLGVGIGGPDPYWAQVFLIR